MLNKTECTMIVDSKDRMHHDSWWMDHQKIKVYLQVFFVNSPNETCFLELIDTLNISKNSRDRLGLSFLRFLSYMMKKIEKKTKNQVITKVACLISPSKKLGGRERIEKNVVHVATNVPHLMFCSWEVGEKERISLRIHALHTTLTICLVTLEGYRFT